MTTLTAIASQRRAIRRYDTDKKLDSNTVKDCIRLATLAPSSDNLQLYEIYHITAQEKLRSLTTACLSQLAAASANQMVIFVIRPDLYRQRITAVLEAEIQNIQRNYPQAKQAQKIKDATFYHQKLLRLLYCRLGGIIGALRQLTANVLGLFRPVLRPISENGMRLVAHKSCALAAQTFMLAMTERGYDTCPLGGIDDKRIKKILHLPRAAEINLVITCGMRHPDGVKGQRHRLDFAEIYRPID